MTMSSYLHNKDNRKDIHNDSNFFESMVNRIYSSELQLKNVYILPVCTVVLMTYIFAITF